MGFRYDTSRHCHRCGHGSRLPSKFRESLRVLSAYVSSCHRRLVFKLASPTVQTQLFSVIPYACAFVTLLGVCTVSDRLNRKGVFLVASLSVASLGYIIILINVSIQMKVFATCLVTSGLYPSVVLVAIWVGMDNGGFMKRAATWALAEISGQSFSILGTRMSIPTHHATSGDTRLCWRSSPLLS